ncbi:hypothetical protein MKX03_037040, partial [Papaver bracteatum]
IGSPFPLSLVVQMLKRDAGETALEAERWADLDKEIAAIRISLDTNSLAAFINGSYLLQFPQQLLLMVHTCTYDPSEIDHRKVKTQST